MSNPNTYAAPQNQHVELLTYPDGESVEMFTGAGNFDLGAMTTAANQNSLDYGGHVVVRVQNPNGAKEMFYFGDTGYVDRTRRLGMTVPEGTWNTSHFRNVIIGEPLNTPLRTTEGLVDAVIMPMVGGRLESPHQVHHQVSPTRRARILFTALPAKPQPRPVHIPEDLFTQR